MDQKTFNTSAVIIFVIAGGLHLIRSIAGWELILNGVIIPVWFSLILFALAVFIIYTAITLNKKG
ncbi:MAG: hypothetical protein CMI53_02685 [Parcubacteria group bacterium]|jgi:hypothetical protein|nr:hypothetical protein [Parcubacteria group bacterium]